MASLIITSQQSFTSIKTSLERLQKGIRQAKAVQQFRITVIKVIQKSQKYRRLPKPATLNTEHQNEQSR